MTNFYSKYPHCHKAITATWGTPECRKYLVELLRDSDNSGKPRQGFTPEDATEILSLLEEHDNRNPHLSPTSDFIKIEFTSIPLSKRRKLEPVGSTLLSTLIRVLFVLSLIVAAIHWHEH